MATTHCAQPLASTTLKVKAAFPAGKGSRVQLQFHGVNMW